jgi:hypothetical protein
MSNIEGRDLYLRVTNKSGESHVQYHRVWDANRFMSAMHAQHNSENLKEEERCKVDIATESDYKKQKGHTK